jgi:hypothetical protein
MISIWLLEDEVPATARGVIANAMMKMAARPTSAIARVISFLSEFILVSHLQSLVIAKMGKDLWRIRAKRSEAGAIMADSERSTREAMKESTEHLMT